MDTLILSCGTGGGHNSAGKAILEEMLKRGHNAVMLNPYNLRSNKLSGKIDHTYISVVQKTPKIFGVAYKLAGYYRRLPFRSPVYFANKAMDDKLHDYLSKNHFDIIIMPHLFPAEIVTNMKKHGMEIPKTMFVSTDYTCIPFTEETDCDAYVIPSQKLLPEYVSRGISENKLHSLGIPVSRAFGTDKSNKKLAREKLSLSQNKKYILVTGGSMGGGKFERSVKKMIAHFGDKDDVEFIVVCGNNNKLREQLCEVYRNNINVKIIGYTDHMADFMKASDLFVTKPGGLSSTEAAVCGLPMLHVSAIPGCETQNAIFFSENGMSIAGEVTENILNSAEKLLYDEQYILKMTSAQHKYINSHSAEDICDLAENLVNFK